MNSKYQDFFMAKLILISNRLPVTIEKDKTDYKYTQSVGGLATGLSSISKNMESVWIGSPGINSDDLTSQDREIIKDKLKTDFKNIAVFLTKKEEELYYSGFSNKTIWPLFHYFQILTVFNKEYYEAYKAVNHKFFEEVLKIANPDDIIWIHDYQLMLLPEMIKSKFPSPKIGFFLHIPFPSFELFRLLPWRKEILNGILGSDLVGFHTYSYEHHFLQSVQRILGLEVVLGQIFKEDRIIKADVFPMGIDFDKFYNSSKNSNTKKEIKNIQKSIKNQKLIISIDRLDYTKGILQRIESFDYFLTKYPQYQKKVTLILVAVPSRINVESYIDLKNQVDEAIGRLNGKYTSLDWSPIWYMYKSLPFETLSALYNMADIALITPLRDGMNLVAKEYVASRNNKNGALIVSEMAGVSEELGEAIIVNPYNNDEIADMINLALNMPNDKQISNIRIMQNRIKKNNIFKWASDFIERLNKTKKMQDLFSTKIIDEDTKKALKFDYSKAGKRLIILDYDGTLVDFKNNPEEAKPDNELIDIIQNLIKNKKNTVVIISGRNKDFLEKCFRNLDLILVAEHGVWIKEYANSWTSISNLNNDWKNNIKPIIESYVDRTPGSFIEEKEYSLVWHYRKTDPEFASIRLKELKGNLLNYIANLNLGIMEGNKVLEIKNIEINKGKPVLFLLKNNYDFILGIGDDVTDEDIFANMPEHSYSIKVGFGITKAKYSIKSYKEVRNLLIEISQD
jgi:trehalose 6-phosphate synthase/phosphatase